MADEKSPTYKDARTMKELLVQLRADADIIAAEIQLQQSQFNCVFLATAVLIGVGAIKSTMNFDAMPGLVLAGIIPLLMLTVAAGQKFFWFNKKTYATIHRDFMPAPLENALELLLATQIKRMDFLINHRDSIRIATVVLAAYLLFLGFMFGWAGVIEAGRPKLPTY